MARFGLMEELVIIIVVGLLLIALLSLIFFVIKSQSRRPFQSEAADQNRRVPCPYCAELILPEAKVCRYCGRNL